MRACINFSLRALILGPSLALLASSQAPCETSARQNLVFGWDSVPRLVERCLGSVECQGSDRELLESLREALQGSEASQPEFVFYSEPTSPFCLSSRDVYSTNRVWSSAIRVCDPRLYHPETNAPLWSPEVALIEMSELALLKSSLADEIVISDLATRMAELSGVRVQMQRQAIKEFRGLRILTLEDRDSTDVLVSSLLAPNWKQNLLELARDGKPCETLGAETVEVSLKRPRWTGGGFVVGEASFGAGMADAVVDCSTGASTFVLKGSFTWRMDFQYEEPLRYTDLRSSIKFEDLRTVSPNP